MRRGLPALRRTMQKNGGLIRPERKEMMKKQEKSGPDTDKPLAKAGKGNLHENKKLRTEEPLAEKDEVKQAEERQRKQMKSK